MDILKTIAVVAAILNIKEEEEEAILKTIAVVAAILRLQYG